MTKKQWYTKLPPAPQGKWYDKGVRQPRGRSAPKMGLAPASSGPWIDKGVKRTGTKKGWIDKCLHEKPRAEREYCQLLGYDDWIPGHAMYPIVKQECIELWQKACPLCGAWFTTPPDLHHLIIQRSAGMTINAWWNCVPLHQECHARAHGEARDTLLAKLYAMIEKVVGENGEQFVRTRSEQAGLLT